MEPFCGYFQLYLFCNVFSPYLLHLFGRLMQHCFVSWAANHQLTSHQLEGENMMTEFSFLSELLLKLNTISVSWLLGGFKSCHKIKWLITCVDLQLLDKLAHSAANEDHVIWLKDFFWLLISDCFKDYILTTATELIQAMSNASLNPGPNFEPWFMQVRGVNLKYTWHHFIGYLVILFVC